MHVNRKSIVIKVLIILCLVYLGIHVLTNGGPVIRELQQSGRSLAALDISNVDTPNNERKFDDKENIEEYI